MGKLLLYNAGRIAQSLQCRSYNSSSSPTNVNYKTTEGVAHTMMYYNTSSSNATYIKTSLRNAVIFDEITGYASADTEADFDVSDYAINALSNVSYSRTEANTTNGKIYTTSITNNGATSVTVGSVKFTKPIATSSQDVATCLVMGYFLNTPVEIGVGETKTIAINLDFVSY